MVLFVHYLCILISSPNPGLSRYPKAAEGRDGGVVKTIEILQVQYMVSFVVGLIGELIQEVAQAFESFGVTVSDAAADGNAMGALTTGIFGTNTGLIYWINEKVFYVIENLPWCDLGQGLAIIEEGLHDHPPCP